MIEKIIIKKSSSKAEWEKSFMKTLYSQLLIAEVNILSVSKCSLYTFTAIPPSLSDPCNFIIVLVVTREPEQTTLLF